MTYLVLDIETVPDRARWTAPANDTFPPVWAHRIVCVGYVALNSSYTIAGGLKLNKFSGADERTTLIDLSRFICALKPHTIVTYNGRKFDLPVIAMRSLCHGVQLPWYYQPRDVRYRFSEQGHLDLADCLTDYGASQMATLDAVAKLIGLPGKVGCDGSQVEALFEAGRLDEIESYCLSDVAQTALLLLRFRLIQGALKHADYEAARDGLMRVFGASAILSSPIGTAPAGVDLRDAARVPEGGATSTEAA